MWHTSTPFSTLVRMQAFLSRPVAISLASWVLFTSPVEVLLAGMLEVGGGDSGGQSSFLGR